MLQVDVEKEIKALERMREANIRKRHPDDTEIWLIVYEASFADSMNPGTGIGVFNSVSGVLQGDALLADMMQAEGGQPSVIPEWFTKGVELLRAKGFTGDDVIPYLQKLEEQRINGST